MGACICTPFGGQKNVLLVVGLDAAGKTTWLHRLQTGTTLTNAQPTVVSNYEDFTYKSVNFALWDLGGQNVYRSLWKYHLSGAKGLLFVLDSTDRLRVHEAKQELFDLLAEEKLREALLVVLANKQVPWPPLCRLAPSPLPNSDSRPYPSGPTKFNVSPGGVRSAHPR
jgi:small GTP-binding protein